MLNSPLEAEAMEGWEAFETDALRQDLATLRNRFDAKKKTKKVLWLRIAASIVVLFTLGISIWLITGQPSEKEYLAEKTAVDKEESAPVAPPIDKEELSDVESEEEIVVEEIVVTEEKPIVQQLIIAERKEEPQELVSAEVSAEKVLAEVVFEEKEKVDMIVDVDLEIVQTDEIELDVAPTIPTAIPSQAKLAASESLEDGGSNALAKVRVAATGAVSRSVSAPERVVFGVVKETEEGPGIPGINVIIEGTNRGAITDLDGQFVLEVAADDEALTFSFIGFETMTLPIQDSMVVEMIPDVASLSEVVVTGFRSRETPDEISSHHSAEPIGGKKAYRDYIDANLNYPDEALANEISGIVKLEVTIEKDGNIGQINVAKSLGFGCDEEAIRLVREGPKWTPASSNEIKVTSQIIIKIRFRLP